MSELVRVQNFSTKAVTKTDSFLFNFLLFFLTFDVLLALDIFFFIADLDKNHFRNSVLKPKFH